MSIFAVSEAADFFIIEEHEIETFDGFDGVVTVGKSCEGEGVDVCHEVKDYEKHDEREMREKCDNYDESEIINKKPKYVDMKKYINTNMTEIELNITITSVEEVIFKKHKVEILNKKTRVCVMEGVVYGYSLTGRVYVPDIILNFDDGRTFYNDNFDYSMRFYI